MWYVLHYNEEAKDICVYEMEIECAYDDALYLSNKYTNLAAGSSINLVYADVDEACAEAESFNDQLTSTIFDFLNNENRLLLQKCTGCGKYFLMDRKEGDWFVSRELKLPRKCVDCRKKMRAERKKGEKHD